MKHLDLFSGIGGFALAAKWAGFETVAFCEIDKYCQKVLRKNFGENIVIHDDIKELKGEQYQGVDLLTGGFPCQPFSIAGKRKGTADPRSLWHEMFRVIQESKPTWVVGENVANFVNMELDNVCADLESEGYEVQPFIIPACGVGAWHSRKRVFVVGYAAFERLKRGIKDTRGNARQKWEAASIEGTGVISYHDGTAQQAKTNGREKYSKEWQTIWDVIASGSTNVGNSKSEYHRGVCDNGKYSEHNQSTGELGGTGLGENRQASYWATEPNVGRVAHGIPSRVDRLRGLGNAVVPQQVYPILKYIAEIAMAQVNSMGIV